MHLALLAVLLSAAPIKLASPGLSYVGVEPKLGDAIVDRFVTELSHKGDFKVTTRNDIAQVLGIERQKQLLGCADTSATCLAELAGGLGVDGIISGSLAKIGTGYTVTLRVVRASDGSEVASASGRAKDEEALQDWLDTQATELAERIRQGFASRAAAGTGGEVQQSQKSGGVVRWVPGIAGAAVLIGGAISFGLGTADASALQRRSPPPTDIDTLVSRGKLSQSLGVGLMITGGAGIAASTLWILLGGSPDARTVSVAPVNGGIVVGLQGAFP